MKPIYIEGMVYMLIASFCFTVNDNLMKLMTKVEGNNIYIYELIFIRGIIASTFIFLWIIITNQLDFKSMFFSKRSYIRGGLESLTMIFFFTGVVAMPLAEVYTLLNVSPLLITLAGFLIFKEKLGLKRLLAVIIGFIGVLIVINPAKFNFNYFFIFPLLAAITVTFREIITAGFQKNVNSIHIVFTSSLVVTIVTGIITIFTYTPINSEYLITIFLTSLFVTIANIFLCKSVIVAPLSITSTFRYSIIVFGLIISYIVLNEVPSINMILGATIIIMSGIFIVIREKKLGKIS